MKRWKNVWRHWAFAEWFSVKEALEIEHDTLRIDMFGGLRVSCGGKSP